MQHGRGEAVTVGREVIEMASCDAQVLPAVVDEVSQGETPCESPAHKNSTPRPRASQSIPPAVRRLVMRRDGGRCRAPGCRCATFLDIHHVIPRAEGGQHDPEQMLVLCGAHHRALHRGSLLIEGNATSGFHFLHADGSDYGSLLQSSPEPLAIEANHEAFLALRRLGFAETAVQQALARVRAEMGTNVPTDAGRLAVAALRSLTPGRRVANLSEAREGALSQPLVGHGPLPTWAQRSHSRRAPGMGEAA
jgi:hypothetical protein